MTLGKRGLVGALLALVLAGGGAFAEEWIKPFLREQFQQFLRDFGLQAQYDDKRVYSAPWHQNLLCCQYLSTPDYVVIAEREPESLTGFVSHHHFCRFKVVSVAPDSFGRRLAGFRCVCLPDSAAALEFSYGNYSYPYMSPMEPSTFFESFAPFKEAGKWEVGEWALINDKPDGKKGLGPDVIFCRNGVIVNSWGEDFGDFQYLPFLQKIDALLQRDPARPAPAPEGFSEAAYQKTVEKVKAWEKADAERRAKEAEEKRQKWERELAQRRAEAARRQAERAPAPGEPREVVSEDPACPAPRAKKAPRQGRHWLWRLFMGCGCPPRAGE